MSLPAKLVLVCFLSLPVLLAQDSNRKVELAGFAQGTWLDVGSGTHPTGGGSIGYGISSRALVFTEVSATVISDQTKISTIAGVTATTNVNLRLTDFQAGMKYSLARAGRFEPYAIVAAGAGRFSNSGDVIARIGTFTSRVVISDVTSHFGLHFGGGARIFIGRHWGVQPEIKYSHYFAQSSDINVARLSGGLFFQFGR